MGTHIRFKNIGVFQSICLWHVMIVPFGPLVTTRDELSYAARESFAQARCAWGGCCHNRTLTCLESVKAKTKLERKGYSCKTGSLLSMDKGQRGDQVRNCCHPYGRLYLFWR